ncbi:MAG: LPS export ABC transporter periplasmic protein LptC [Elusimicrobiaceae bacterium]
MKIKLSLLLLALVLAGCSDDLSRGKSGGGLTQEVKGLRLYELQSGEKEWIILADKAALYEKDQTGDLKNPVIEMRKNKKLAARITSEKGRIDFSKKLVTLERSVEGESKTEQVELKTELLNYDIDAEKIWTDSSIQLRQYGVLVKGKGFTAKPDLSEIEIKNQETTLPKNVSPAKVNNAK